MANQVEEKENSPEISPDEQDLPEEPEPGVVLEARVAELESLVRQKDGELEKARARSLEFEQTVADRDDEITLLTQSKVEMEEKLTSLSSSLAEAVTSYKTAVVQANPEILEELITGDNIEAINESLDKAKALVSKVKQGVEAEILLARVPAGAPERTTPDLSALSPREKIQYAIGGRR